MRSKRARSRRSMGGVGRLPAIVVVALLVAFAGGRTVGAAGVPSAPPSAVATPGNGAATVTWGAADGNGLPVTGYQVKTVRGGATLRVDNVGSGDRSVTIPGLTNGLAYVFSVAAVNSAGVGAAQSTWTITVGSPGPPTITSAAGSTGGTIALTWSAPTITNSGPVTGYVVNTYTGPSLVRSTTFNSPALGQSISGLTGGTSYQFNVQAVNGSGVGARSAPSAVVVAPASVPAAPTNVIIDSSTVLSCVVSGSWTAPGTGGSALTGYRIAVDAPGHSTTTTDVAASSPSALITAPAASGVTVKVAALNAQGVGPYSVPSAPFNASGCGQLGVGVLRMDYTQVYGYVDIAVIPSTLTEVTGLTSGRLNVNISYIPVIESLIGAGAVPTNSASAAINVIPTTFTSPTVGSGGPGDTTTTSPAGSTTTTPPSSAAVPVSSGSIVYTG